MPLVRSFTTYQVLGKDFKDVKAIQRHIENCLGDILDKKCSGEGVQHSLSTQQKLGVFKAMFEDKKSREQIVRLLTVEIDVGEDSMQENIKNVLDL